MKYIICAGLWRSGSSLMYNILRLILEKSGSGKALGWFDNLDSIDFRRPVDGGQIRYGLVKTHEFHESYLPIVQSGEMRVIFTFRDVRDVVVSMMNKGNQSFHDVYSKNFEKSFKANFEGWTKCPGAYIVKYETFVVNLDDEVAKVASFLGIMLAEEELLAIAQELSIDNQRKKIDLEQGLYDVGVGYNQETLLHRNHIFSGESGQWRNRLTCKQIVKIESEFSSWLEGHSYKRSNWTKLVGYFLK